MKLINCDIENFGCFSNFHMDFNEGCNVIHEENGWGKSTMAAFLRVMFYGFENGAKRDEYENERKRYMPWQGGVYGGKLTFETDGHRYTVIRTFGNKEADDTFVVRDCSTNLETDIFSDKIGVELFNIDSSSFIRSVFISQNDCETKLTDGINAKLGNIADNTDDINNFEKVDKELKDILNKMSPKRSTGSIAKLKSEITELEMELSLLPKKEAAIKENRQLLEKAKNNRTNLENEIKEISEKVNTLNAEIKICKEKDELYKLTVEEKSEFDELGKIFLSGVPDEDEISQMKEKWVVGLGKKESLVTTKLYLENQELVFANSKKPATKLYVFMWVMAAVALCTSASMFFYKHTFIGVFIAVMAVAMAVIGFVMKNSKPKEVKEPESILQLREELNNTRKMVDDIETIVRSFIQTYGGKYESDNVSSDLDRIHRNVVRIKELLSKQQKYSNTASTEVFDKQNRVSEYQVVIGVNKDQCEKLTANINQYMLNITRLEEEYDSIFQKKELLDAKKEQLIEDTRKYELIGKTKDILEEAKVSFGQKFMKPISDGFTKYISIIDKIGATKYIIDANGEISIEEKGRDHDKRFMSAGYRDLIGVSMRMALVDAMFKDEKPFVIFDDPFINMDENKTEGALKFLEEISKEYQVVYFTCHKSRAM